MKLISKVLLTVEVLVCFGPLTIVLLLGIAIAPLQLAGMVLGMLPVAFYAFGPVDSMGWRLAGLLPLACTFHLAYLARDFLFSGFSRNESFRAE